MYDINKLQEIASMFNVEVSLYGEDQDKLQMIGTNGDINKFFEEAKRQGLLDKDPFDESYKVVDEKGNKVEQGGGFTSKKEAELFAAQYGQEGLKVVRESYNPEDTSWMDDLIDALRTYPSNNEIENDAFLKELRELYYKHYPDSDKIIEEETLMERMDFDTLYQKVKEQDRPIHEGLFGTLLFNTSFANKLYDEFYRPLTDLIKKGDKEGAMKEWQDIKDDFDKSQLEKKKWARTFVEVQKDRMEKYKAQIDAMEDAKVEEPALVESLQNKDFDIEGFTYTITDTFEDEGVIGHNIIYSKNGIDIVEVEIWEEDSPVMIISNLHTPNLMEKTYDDFQSFATDLKYKSSTYLKEEMISNTRNITIEGVEDREECPYLLGEDSTQCEIANRFDLTEDELWCTGWVGAVQNCNAGPFNSFDELDIYCYDTEKGTEYTLPEIPEDIKNKFLTEVNKYIEEVGTMEEGYKPHTKRLLKLIGSDKLDEEIIEEAAKPSPAKLHIEEMVKDEFESGHRLCYDYDDFKEGMKEDGFRGTPALWDYYQELRELGPAGFYEEFKDKFEFDSMFVSEYGGEEDDEYDDYEESYTPISEDIDDEYEVPSYKAENTEFVMNEYISDSYGVESINKVNDTTYKVLYDGTEVEIVFDFGWDEWVYTINGKGPFAHSSYEWIISDIQNVIDDEPIQESYFEDEPSWLDDEDPVDADREHANLYGGDRTYCDTCGSRLAMDEWGGYCPKCNPPELDEAFDTHSDIDLDMVGVRVANLLDVEALGEDNWIEFDCKETRALIGAPELHMAFEATGANKMLRGYMRARTDGTIAVYIKNGSEGEFRNPEEIARFIAGEFGISI